ncbi:MAG: hypothetical protein M0Z50_04735 [Planctomycetia bacterium]|nr:hypothetical protein [Planctomycetia bacterium]
MIRVTFDQHQCDRLERLLRDTPAKLISAERAAVSRASKAGARQITNKAAELLSDHRRKTVRSRILLRQTVESGHRVSAAIAMPFRPIGLIHFGAKQDSAGVSGIAGGVNLSVPHAFIARGRGIKKPGARVVFIRQPGARHHQHIGRSGLNTWAAGKIRPVFGATLAGLLIDGGISEEIYAFIRQRLNKELDGQIGRFWRSHGK